MRSALRLVLRNLHVKQEVHLERSRVKRLYKKQEITDELHPKLKYLMHQVFYKFDYFLRFFSSQLGMLEKVIFGQ